MQVQGRSYHGLSLLASYSIRKTLTNTAGKDIQHNGPAGRGLLQDPHNLMEAYGVALYEMPQTLLLNYNYDLPFGKGRTFLNHGDGIGYKVFNAVAGGWAVAGISTYNPKGTPVLVPDVGTGTTVPGAALRYTLAPNVNPRRSGASYSQALAFNGGFVNSSPQGVLNPAAFITTPDYGLSNAPFVFPNLRNPGSFFTDATLLKKFYLSGDGERYLEARVEAINILNHANYGPIDNNPDSATFGAVQGKGINQQQGFNLNNPPRTMQIGLRLFF
jgi:hypothetical protein